MRGKLTILAIVAILLGGTAWAATTNYRYEYSAAGYHSCMQGWVQLDVKVHVVYKSESDGAGGYHIKSHTNSSIAGEILSGPYAGAKLTGSSSYNYNVNVQPGITYTTIQNYNLNGQGQAPNYKVKVTYHYTINANGELTAYVNNVDISCD
jgi:hypothetical protein